MSTKFSLTDPNNNSSNKSLNQDALASRLYSSRGAHGSLLSSQSKSGNTLIPNVLRMSVSQPVIKTINLKSTIHGNGSMLNPSMAKSLTKKSPNKKFESQNIVSGEKINSPSKLQPVTVTSDETVMFKTFLRSLNLSINEMDELMNVPNTFYYMLPQKKTDTKFYDLELVSQETVDPIHYYTISREGVTQYRMKESHFTTLTQWEREFRLFHKISRIRFFKQYRCWKVCV